MYKDDARIGMKVMLVKTTIPEEHELLGSILTVKSKYGQGIVSEETLVLSSGQSSNYWYYDQIEPKRNADEHSQEDIKMHIEDVSKANLRLAKKQFDEQHKTAQVEFALEQYRMLQDTKERLETTIRVTQEKLDEVNKELEKYV